MSDAAIHVRRAARDDAHDVARVYIDSWRDTYPGVVPSALLCAMTERGQTARWSAAIAARGREAVFVAEKDRQGVIGMCSFGPARDSALGLDGEVYTLYVDPSWYGQGAGRALLNGAFAELRGRGFGSCIIWAHAKNPARFFYEAMGGKLVGRRNARMMGEMVAESAFGWPALALAERSAAH